VEDDAFFLLWCLWSERNDISFEDCKKSLAELESFFIFHSLYLDNCVSSSLGA
jgi:hypothetical protein